MTETKVQLKGNIVGEISKALLNHKYDITNMTYRAEPIYPSFGSFPKTHCYETIELITNDHKITIESR